MHIEKIKLRNFKKFCGEYNIKFNYDFNIIIGNNESGKSTILQAIDLALSGSQNKIDNIGLENLFNVDVIKDFLESEKSYKNLPILLIELYLNETTNPDLNGNNNSDKKISDGVFLKIEPNDDYSNSIINCLKQDNPVFPFEYYRCIFKTFSDQSYNSYNKQIHHILIDGSSISNEFQMKSYINTLYSSYADDITKNFINNEYRKMKNNFTNNNLTILNKNMVDLNFGFSSSSKYSLENNLSLYDNGVDIQNKGSGTQCMLKIKTTIDKNSKKIDLILIEEPENHLSDTNMKKMLQDIKDTNGKQMFITTHNSMICSRLDIRKIIALGNNKILTKEFNDIKKETSKFFAKCTNNNILSFIISNSVILVEGAAEYILIEKFYEMINGHNPNLDNVNIISVNGLSFERYLEVAKTLNTKVVVITDNDGDFETNIQKKYFDYKDNINIKVFSSLNNNLSTFEICLYENNKEYYQKSNITKATSIQEFMLNNKAEHAYRLLEILEKDSSNFHIPEYVIEAIKWIKD